MSPGRARRAEPPAPVAEPRGPFPRPPNRRYAPPALWVSPPPTHPTGTSRNIQTIHKRLNITVMIGKTMKVFLELAPNQVELHIYVIR